MNPGLSTQHSALPDWLAYLEQLHPKTIDLGLDRVSLVKDRLGLALPFPIITVGGTNGKGSVCAMLEAMLSAAGFRVGLYTSPHLLRYSERVRIDRVEATDAELCEAFAAVEAARGEVSLTYFEFGTLAAMWQFARAGVEAVILEVGLGGRLDAVNAFEPDCVVVTSVDLDHTDYLGDSREKIGFEKAGIFRRGRPVICGDFSPPRSLVDHAAAIGADLQLIGPDFSFEADSTQWRFRGRRSRRVGLPLPALRGAFQVGNAAVCLAALDELRERLPVSVNDIRRGLVEVSLPGRFQVLPGRPQTILDVAHNPHAAQSLATNLANLPASGKTIAVFAMLRDKDIAGVVRALKGRVDLWLLASIGQPRGAAAEDLLAVLRQEGVAEHALCFSVIGDAYGHACNLAGEDDKILVFGSFYTVAEVLDLRSKAA